MADSVELKKRFNELMSRLESIRARLEVAEKDGTVVVDAGDLDIKCQRYQAQVDQILALPNAPEIDDDLGRLLIDLKVSVDDIGRCCSDLEGPLDRLISAIYEYLPDDPEYHDDTR